MKNQTLLIVGVILLAGAAGAAALGSARRQASPAKRATQPAPQSASPPSAQPVSGAAHGSPSGEATHPEGAAAAAAARDRRFEALLRQPGIPKRVISHEAKAAHRALYAETERLKQDARALLKAGDLGGAERTALAAMAATPVVGGKRLRPVLGLPFLLGDIYLRQEKYREALSYYLPGSRNTMRFGLNLDVALCYSRLGDHDTARRFYSDRATLQYDSRIRAADLPGTGDPKSLEASILLARGMDAYVSDRNQEAFDNFEAAGRLAPQNGLIPFYVARSLAAMNREMEAKPYYRLAAQNGQGEIARAAREILSRYSM